MGPKAGLFEYFGRMSGMLKCCNSLYLNNLLSVSSRIWPRGTLEGRLSFHDIGPMVYALR